MKISDLTGLYWSLFPAEIDLFGLGELLWGAVT